MEGYSQQGFRPGRLAIIIKAPTTEKNIGKAVELLKVVLPGETVEHRGEFFESLPGEPVAWVVKSLDGRLQCIHHSGKRTMSVYGFVRQENLMLIDDPDKELDTMEERLNNAHPLLLNHEKEVV